MDSPDYLKVMLQQRFAFFNALLPVLMSWWVSSVLFCGSLLGGVWSKRRELARMRYRDLFASFVLCFLVSIVAFGALVFAWTFRWQNEVGILLVSAKRPETDIDTDAWFMRLALITGTSTFFFATIVWIGIWIWLRREALRVLTPTQAIVKAEFIALYERRGVVRGQHYPVLDHPADGYVRLQIGKRELEMPTEHCHEHPNPLQTVAQSGQ